MTSTPRRKAIQQIAARQIQSVEDYLGVAGTDIYGQYVFGDKAQRQYLPKDVYKKLRRTIEGGEPLDVSIADAVAQGMKAWAMSLGASHYTHWFVPMTGSSAEKHDSFLSPTGLDGILAEFTKSALIKGEPDASSFPSGGIRSTFEARGYTAWDPSCPAFVQVEPNGVTLTIPTAFCSYTGEALDHKTPLLRSQEALNKQALRILRKFGNHTAKHVYTTMGAEQEYFLIDRHFYELRPDLLNCGRTLFGAPPSKGQELEDHYFGAIRERILAYMMDLDRELWRLGIPVKTRHNEVAPAQFEIAPVFESASIASDHNMITMQVMRRLALQHGLACIMHEKPFAGVNGSGKHNNWSMSTDSGENLLEPGHNPHENAQFLTYLVAIMHAINKHSDLMRVAVADAGNDHRLGANEAPPAIISIFLGEQLEDIIEQLEKGPATASKSSGALALGVTALPELPRDATDRNRTSPFAFTGNKFEFRAVGSSAAIYWPQTILNTIVAEALDAIATKIEAIQGDFMTGLQKILQEEIRDHKRILFSGNNYSSEWHEEAARRGLPNLPSTVDALPRLDLPENRALFAKYAVLSEKEVVSRAEIAWERYVKVLNIEALTAVEMAKNQILPAALKYQGQVAQAIAATASVVKTAQKGQTALLEKIVGLTSSFVDAIHALEEATAKASAAHGEIHHAARAFRDEVLPAMQALRALGDELETLVADEYWPLPKYREMLFQY